MAAPGAARLLMASLVASIPSGAIGVLIILHVKYLGGSYALAGLTAGGYTTGAAITGPYVGRLVDRHLAIPVLTGCMVLTAVAVTGLALLTADSPGVLFVALATAGGLTHPPVGAMTRTLLPTLVREDGALHAAYALESSALELSYIVGPALIGGLIASQSTQAALLVDAGLLVLGTMWFMSLPAPRQWRPAVAADPQRRSRASALRSPSTRLLLLVITAFSVSFGAVEVAVTAAASELDARSLTGPLLATWGFGSLVGGVLLATRAAPVDARRRLLWLLAALAFGDLSLVLTSGSWAFAALLPISGLAIAPAFAVVNAMNGLSAAEGASTEAFAWLGTGVSAGFSAGAVLAGPAADLGGASGAFGVSLGAVLFAMLLVLGGRRLLPVSEREPAAVLAARP
ncbi:MAG: transporter [Solirubrobacterales bacterium]|nr:transporter [Solirubrobacterales bacterium]